MTEDREDKPPPEPPAGEPPPVAGKVVSRARKANQDERVIRAVRALRGLLPGDERFGDPLSTAGTSQPEVVGRQVSKLSDQQPGALREAGLSALQVWQAFSEARGRGRGDRDLTILFTDLVGFSSWALEAGDDVALELLRAVGEAIEPPVREHQGEVVKRLGDGLMAVFEHPADAIEAVWDMQEGLEDVEVGGYRPRMRAGLHVGKPRRIGGDYLGVDVNIAARIAEGAGPCELLLSDAALEFIEDPAAVGVRRKRRFKAKGVPKDVTVHAIDLADDR
jgi:adenylate cyclase